MAAFVGFVVFCYDPPYVPWLLPASRQAAIKAAQDPPLMSHRLVKVGLFYVFVIFFWSFLQWRSGNGVWRDYHLHRLSAKVSWREIKPGLRIF